LGKSPDDPSEGIFHELFISSLFFGRPLNARDVYLCKNNYPFFGKGKVARENILLQIQDHEIQVRKNSPLDSISRFNDFTGGVR
jgi:hypothetical protein